VVVRFGLPGYPFLQLVVIRVLCALGRAPVPALVRAFDAPVCRWALFLTHVRSICSKIS
jgi:hypothetical protein